MKVVKANGNKRRDRNTRRSPLPLVLFTLMFICGVILFDRKQKCKPPT